MHTRKIGTGKETLTVQEVTASAYAKEVGLRNKGLLKKGRGQAEGLIVESRGRSDKRNDSGGNK